MFSDPGAGGLLQRYGQSSLFKRTVLDLIAEDLLALPQSEDGGGECRVDDDMKPVRFTRNGLGFSTQTLFCP